MGSVGRVRSEDIACSCLVCCGVLKEDRKTNHCQIKRRNLLREAGQADALLSRIDWAQLISMDWTVGDGEEEEATCPPLGWLRSQLGVHQSRKENSREEQSWWGQLFCRSRRTRVLWEQCLQDLVQDLQVTDSPKYLWNGNDLTTRELFPFEELKHAEIWPLACLTSDGTTFTMRG